MCCVVLQLQLFHSEDLLVSHLSVMCVSAVVLHQLHQTVSTYPLTVQSLVRYSNDFCISPVVSRTFVAGGHPLPQRRSLVAIESLKRILLLCLSRAWSLLLQPAVRRRVLVLLKKALVQKAGEDWTGGQSGLRCNDVSLLANSVLRVAAGGGLKGVRVEGESFFGGTVGSGPSVDNVTLRALCLVLLKAMELQCQPSQLELVPFHLCLQSLWDVLPADPVAHPSGQPHHCCSRLSSVFGEQDDDMIEAAKALLSIFLHHRFPALSPTPHPLWACSLGLNPHCHFLLLLRSLAFDHRVLLDFLISTETCFLEYFVCYLRLLRTDPEGFSAACSEPRTEWGTRGSERTECAEGVGQNCGVLLVDYSSSGESETEEAEGAVNCGRDQDRGSCWGAAVRCLSLLLELMSRLHSKNLFPYNPSSLMKLLTEAEASLKSVPIKQ
uniref:Lines homolog 1 n=1 Tax=Periophthalmus magnuspinnatus TaxID=409849 RepID=A0A3B4AHZ6_9GOBI